MAWNKPTKKRKPKLKKVVEERLPPVRTVEEYLADCQLGIQRVGKPISKKG